jgi:hypothetical protein
MMSEMYSSMCKKGKRPREVVTDNRLGTWLGTRQEIVACGDDREEIYTSLLVGEIFALVREFERVWTRLVNFVCH